MIWAIVLVVAIVACAIVAAFHARRSWLARAIVADVVVLIPMAVLASGCDEDEGNCSVAQEAATAIEVLALLALPVLLVVVGVRWWSSRDGALPLEGRDLFLVVTGLVFLLISVPMTFDEPLAGAGGVVFSLALLALPVAGRWGRAGRAGPRAATVHGRPAIVIDGLGAKIWAGRAVLTVAGIAGAVWAVVDTGFDRIVGGAMAVCFGYVIAWSLLRARGRFRLVIQDDGLSWQAGQAPEHVGWNELEDVGVSRIRSTAYLTLPGRDVPLESFPVDPERLAGALYLYATRPELRGEIGTAASLARLTRQPRVRQPVELDTHDVGQFR